MTDMETPGFRVERRDQVAWITLDRPGRRNALAHELIVALDRTARQLGEDRGVRVIVLAAEGPVFCSGHDLGEMVGRSEEAYGRIFGDCSRFMGGLRRLPQPVIARVQGPAVAAGCQLVAACDLAVAAETATFSTPGVKIGLFCTTPMVPLVRTVAPRAALEMLLTGVPISASRALELGLVNRVVPLAGLDAAVAELVEPILAASPVATRIGKAAFYDQIELDEPAAYERATGVMTSNALEAECGEGITAFLEKRAPRWSGSIRARSASE
jgi:enoyl-CoA hydratase/carnithine racemase